MPVSHSDSPAGFVSSAFGGPASHDNSRPLYIDADRPDRAIQAGGLRRFVRSLVAGFTAYGIRPGDGVQLMNLNVIHPAIFFGIIGAGGVYMCCKASTSSYEMGHLIQLVFPRLIQTHFDALPVVLPVSADHRPAPLDHLLAFGKDDWAWLNGLDAQRPPATMFMASGTSGLPEVAVRRNYALISQYRGVYYEPPFHVTRLAVLPLHHLLADFWTSIFPIRYSHPVCIMRRFDAAGLQNARRFSITETYLVPTMVQVLTQCSLSVDEDILQQFQTFPPPKAYVTQWYGMTELGVIARNRYGDPVLRHLEPSHGLYFTIDSRLVDAGNCISFTTDWSGGSSAPAGYQALVWIADLTQLGQGLRWAINYALMAYKSYQESTYAMSIIQLCCNFAWGLVYTFIYFSRNPLG
ncbi:hypothetical protein CNMCM8694_004212 [Aspergillus lentulus]|nr:hypothetical protein CNMCM8060_004253 [Aspergillus lentulus]KAF4185794.1 hypothetical protein CNMCM7927_006219 [Aspergillus lentulus]KAF4196952.1 hypothetical protein CNMCM8694_004212 [Aspergillus lentulus]